MVRLLEAAWLNNSKLWPIGINPSLIMSKHINVLIIAQQHCQKKMFLWDPQKRGKLCRFCLSGCLNFKSCPTRENMVLFHTGCKNKAIIRGVFVPCTYEVHYVFTGSIFSMFCYLVWFYFWAAL